MTQYKHIDWEIPRWGELAQGPAVVPGLLTTMLASQPAGLWLSPGGGTTWWDISGNAIHGTATNATYSGSGPLARLAVIPGRFAGGGYVDMGVSAAICQANSLTCEAWAVFTSALTGVHDVIGANGFSGPYGFTLRYIKDVQQGWNFMVDSARYVSFQETAPPPNVWRHYVGTYDAAAGNMRLYINGQLTASKSVTPGRSKINYALRLGNWAGYAPGWDRVWPGGMALAAVYLQPLSAATVAQHCRLGVQGP